MNPTAEHIKQTIRLADLVPGLKRHGRYWVGPCPLCGEGVDRFNVKESPDGDGWLCRKCAAGKYHDALDFLQRRDGLTFAQVLERYGGSSEPSPKPAARPRLVAPKLDMPPDDEWQAAALQAAAECADYLRSDAPDARAARRYLQDERKLTQATLDTWMIGFNPTWRDVTGDGRLAPGITIPAMADGELWYLKVRTTEKARSAGKLGKYHALKGGRLGMLFGADRLIGASAAIIVEGEFDALVLSQYVSPSVAVVTMGGAGNVPGITWGRYFAATGDILLLLDEDEAGRAALARWQSLFPRARAIHPPDGLVDVTDFRRAGGNVVAWAAAVLREAQS